MMKTLVGAVVCAMLVVPVVAQAQAPEASPEAPVVKGALDKEVIRRVIRTRSGGVRKCYERGLMRAGPGLSGKLVVEFVVGRSGKVESTVIKDSTLGDAKVEQCVADQIKTFVFPKPKGGGIVIVQYPFVFKSSADEPGVTHALGRLESDDATFGTIGQKGKGKATTAGGKIVPGKPVVQGSLDKEIIRRVVRQHRNEVRYCYDKSLMKDPNLAGRIDVKFVISKTGSVASAVVTKSTMGSAAVEGCITKKVRRWVFPEPKGGGIVIVKYPFVFSSAGAAKSSAGAAKSPPEKAAPSGTKGRLDKKVIARVVRQNRNGIRMCYEKELKKDPGLAGTVNVKFVIGATGAVESAKVAKSTIKNKAVESCVAKKVGRWVFPAPQGGSVAVVYPFKFSSGM